MKRYILFLLILFYPSFLMAQQYAEYNRKGDEAMNKKDYFDARFWYGEGVEYCDTYSIKQLTTIWLNNTTMRSSMRNIMGRCYTCLQTLAENDDMAAITQLVLFYREGIGVEMNETQAQHWEERKTALESPRLDPSYRPTLSAARNPMRFFVGYAFSTEMPYGITFGGMKNKMGWYVRVKTNFSFETTEKECELAQNAAGEDITNLIDPEHGKTYFVNQDKGNKKNSMAGSVGFVYQTTPWLNLSIGAGYGQRILATPIVVRDNRSMLEEEIWCKNRTYSSEGILLEVDAMIRYKNLFFSVGCHTMRFDYVDLNAGIGMYF